MKLPSKELLLYKYYFPSLCIERKCNNDTASFIHSAVKAAALLECPFNWTPKPYDLKKDDDSYCCFLKTVL